MGGGGTGGGDRRGLQAVCESSPEYGVYQTPPDRIISLYSPQPEVGGRGRGQGQGPYSRGRGRGHRHGKEKELGQGRGRIRYSRREL